MENQNKENYYTIEDIDDIDMRLKKLSLSHFKLQKDFLDLASKVEKIIDYVEELRGNNNTFWTKRTVSTEGTCKGELEKKYNSQAKSVEFDKKQLVEEKEKLEW